MIQNIRNSFLVNYSFFTRILYNNPHLTHSFKKFHLLNKFLYYSKFNFSTSSFDNPPYKSHFSTITHQFNDKSVDLTHLPLPIGYINSLKSLGIKDLRLFQYIIFKVLTDNLVDNSSSKTRENLLRLIFYNDIGSGQSIGSLIPLVYVYSSKYRGSTPTDYRTGSLLILCSGGNCHRISNLLLGIEPSLKCLVLDDCSHHGDSKQIGHDFGTNSRDYFTKILKQKELSRKGSYDVIIAAHNFLLRETKKSNLALLSGVSCVLFDDFTELKDYNVFNKNIKVVRESKKININDHECSKDFHIICLICSLCDPFPEYSTNNLPNYTLYDFKYGTKQKLISDSRTDVLKVDVEFGQAKVINLESEECYENKKIEHSICKVSKGEKHNRISVLKNLVYSYLDLPTFMYSQAMPLCLKKPTPSAKCIIFVSNRKQLNKLANVTEFSTMCVYLGRHLNVYERAKSISSFNNGSRPIMIATDNSIYGSVFDNVSHIFNFHPPKTVESYKSRAGFARKNNALCVTLYSKDQYPRLVSVIKQAVKRVSIHIVPSREYMIKHDVNWLKRFIDQIVSENGNLIAPYLKRSEELLLKFGDSIVTHCTNVLLRDGLASGDSMDHCPVSSSILSGKSGFTAVIINDVSKQHINDESDIKNILSKYAPDSKVNSAIGKCCKTETGYIVDISNKYIKNFVELSRDNPDIHVQIATEVPKIILNNTHIGKIHKKGLDWNTLDLKRPPAITMKGF